jgi:ZIP family zinc transporter
MDSLLGFAAGIMLAATVFGLITPAIDEGGTGKALLGLLAGVALLGLADNLVPHLHFLDGSNGPGAARLRRVWLFILALTIHNLPEGLAVGVGFGPGDIAAGIVLAVGIGIQDMPEGLAVSLSLVREGYGSRRAIAYATLTGLAEPVTALIGISLVVIIGPLIPFGLAFAGGAMLYILIDEMIPESHHRGNHLWATSGTVAGFVLMTALERLFA